MGGVYKVRYKKGDLEIEVESHDHSYVTMMIEKLKAGSTAPPADKEQQRTPPLRNQGSKPVRRAAIDVSAICKAVETAKEYPLIKKNVLKRKEQLGRILLAFWSAMKCSRSQITTGDVARITEGFGIGVSQSNASKIIVKNSDFFSALKERRQGSPMPYKLTRRGQRAFLSILEP